MSGEDRRRLAEELERERRESRREVDRARRVRERFDRELEGLVEDLRALAAGGPRGRARDGRDGDESGDGPC